MFKYAMRTVLALSILLLLLGICTSCKDAAHTCTKDDDCGYSCTYGCVNPSWYAEKNETRECSRAEPCTCVNKICYTGGKKPQNWALEMKEKERT